jgi:putative membrane protein
MLPWMLVVTLAGLIAVGFWIGHRVSHRRSV